MAVAPEVDRRTVAAGALAGLALAVPAVVAFAVVDAVADLGPDSNAVFPFFAVVVAGWVVAGVVAGRRQREAPLTHGALAALGAYLAVFAVRMVAAVATGGDLPVVEALSNSLLAASAGVIGGLLANRRAREAEGRP